jgi:hypothetical protein
MSHPSRRAPRPFFRMSRSAFSLATSRRSRSISCCSGFICPWQGKACRGPAVASRIHRRSTLSATSRSLAACTTETPRSRTNFTASSLNSRLNSRRFMLDLRSRENLHSVSTKPAAAHSSRTDDQRPIPPAPFAIRPKPSGPCGHAVTCTSRRNARIAGLLLQPLPTRRRSYPDRRNRL